MSNNTYQSIIHMISGPRNLSTAMMYAFNNRRDTLGVDEPFYAYYLSAFDVSHPGKEDIIKHYETDPNKVLQQLIDIPTEVSYLFVKNMAHHLRGFDFTSLFDAPTIFLIRDPALLIHSFAKVIEDCKAEDIGILQEYNLFQVILKTNNDRVAVVDSEVLLNNPHYILKKLCKKLDIPFDADMLSWARGPKSIDGIWAPYWYKNVHNSTSFQKQNTSKKELTDSQQKVYKEVMPAYEYLFEKSIKI